MYNVKRDIWRVTLKMLREVEEEVGYEAVYEVANEVWDAIPATEIQTETKKQHA